jgi:hypothetical protein
VQEERALADVGGLRDDALGNALGIQGRDKFEAMVNAELDKR